MAHPEARWPYRLLLVAAGGIWPFISLLLVAGVFHVGTQLGIGWITILALPILPAGYWFLNRRFARTYPLRYEFLRADMLFKALTSFSTLLFLVLVVGAVWLLVPETVMELLTSR